MSNIDLDSFICYNWMPMIADHSIDNSESFYDSAGVSRLHDLPQANPRDIEENDIVFVKTDFLFNRYFQDYFLPQVKNKFVLISGVSSYHLGSNGDDSYNKVLQNENVLKWFCTNPPNVISDKIIPLPIGFEEKERTGGDQNILLVQRQNRINFNDKKNKILLPYHDFETNSFRKSIFDDLRRFPFVETQEDKLSFDDYIGVLNEYKFVICLEGSGPDIHRNYECLLVDSVPINVKNTINAVFDYHKIPGIFINDWSDLNKEKFDNIMKEEYDFANVEKFLKISYHADIVKGYV